MFPAMFDETRGYDDPQASSDSNGRQLSLPRLSGKSSTSDFRGDLFLNEVHNLRCEMLRADDPEVRIKKQTKNGGCFGLI